MHTYDRMGGWTRIAIGVAILCLFDVAISWFVGTR
jgi:hypothetical protein